MKIKYITITCLLFLVFSIQAFGQKKEIKINGVPFLFRQVKLDTSAGAEVEIVALFRGNKKLLTHTLFKEEGDCSSNQIQIGKYKITDDKIIFYSYWASNDRMPGSTLPFGFRKQEYAVNNLGLIKLLDSEIYLENLVKTENKDFLEKNGWKHKGLKFLSHPTKNQHEQELLQDYTDHIGKEYNAQFVSRVRKDDLEKEVRNNLKDEIKKFTENWIAGEVYGRVKK